MAQRYDRKGSDPTLLGTRRRAIQIACGSALVLVFRDSGRAVRTLPYPLLPIDGPVRNP
jgi:hypothetical protein